MKVFILLMCLSMNTFAKQEFVQKENILTQEEVEDIDFAMVSLEVWLDSAVEKGLIEPDEPKNTSE